jgi:hypothetical protein
VRLSTIVIGDVAKPRILSLKRRRVTIVGWVVVYRLSGAEK